MLNKVLIPVLRLGPVLYPTGIMQRLCAFSKNLVAENTETLVSDESASFTAMGAIAMQKGIRLINPTLGETIVVTGLGLLGLLAVQILKANGCQVLGRRHCNLPINVRLQNNLALRLLICRRDKMLRCRSRSDSTWSWCRCGSCSLRVRKWTKYHATSC